MDRRTTVAKAIWSVYQASTVANDAAKGLSWEELCQMAERSDKMRDIVDLAHAEWLR